MSGGEAGRPPDDAGRRPGQGGAERQGAPERRSEAERRGQAERHDEPERQGAADGRVRVTVVVPARDAAATIGRAVACIVGQAGAPAFELVVVDNASTDDTGAIAAAAGARVVRLDDRAGGPGRARNAGVAAARGTHVAFTDADCFPTAGWLRALWAAAGSAELVAGPVAADASAVRGTWDRTLEYAAPTALWATANLLIGREVLTRAGSFDDWVADADEAPRRPFGEDTVLAWRAIRGGARTAWAPDALVEHAVFARDARGWILHHRDLRHMPGLIAQVPELRRELLRGGLVLNAATATTSIAAAGLATAVLARRPSPLLLTLPWAARQLRAARTVGVRIAAVRAAGELVGATSLVAGAVRHRTPVL